MAGNVPRTYEEFEKNYHIFVSAAVTAFNSELTKAHKAALNEDHVLEAIQTALKRPELQSLLQKALASFHSPRVTEPDYDENLALENRDKGLSASSLKAVPWGNKFDSADNLRPLVDNLRPIAKEIADGVNNDLKNQNQLKNKAKNKPSLTPQYKAKLELAARLIMGAENKKRKEFINTPIPTIPRLTR